MKIKAEYKESEGRWVAYDDNTYDEGAPLGTGSTYEEALNSLVERLITHEVQKTLKNLASAIKKVAPEAASIIAVKLKDQKKSYEKFLAFLRS